MQSGLVFEPSMPCRLQAAAAGQVGCQSTMAKAPDRTGPIPCQVIPEVYENVERHILTLPRGRHSPKPRSLWHTARSLCSGYAPSLWVTSLLFWVALFLGTPLLAFLARNHR